LAFLQQLEQQYKETCDGKVSNKQIVLDPNLGGIVWTNETDPRRVNSTDKSNGLMETGMLGISNITGHIAKIRDRDFAWRGPVVPNKCPSERN